ncbi:MAG: Uma2 family endonuclease [Cyanobacteria bacterium J06606_4]
MVQQLSTSEAVIYPDSDGQPMADNTLQFQWIVTIKENLELMYSESPDVFVAGDLLWYPVEGNNKIRQAPDALVAFGRPKGYRGSYQQWKEDNIAPQVVFEILSPGNRRTEMAKKLLFYERYGVEEYYEYDPYNVELVGWQRQGDGLEPIETLSGWSSPLLGIRFELTPETLVVYGSDGSRFLTFVELGQRLDETNQRLAASQARADRLAAKLKALGVDPDDLS